MESITPTMDIVVYAHTDTGLDELDSTKLTNPTPRDIKQAVKRLVHSHMDKVQSSDAQLEVTALNDKSQTVGIASVWYASHCGFCFGDGGKTSFSRTGAATKLANQLTYEVSHCNWKYAQSYEQSWRDYM